MTSAVDLLTNPDTFFRNRTDHTSLLYPASIVLLAGLISLIGGLPLLFKLTSAFGGLTGNIATVIPIVSSVFGLVTVFIVWAIYAGLFHVISTVFDGEGTFRNTLTLVGYGFVPNIFASVVSAAVSFVVYSGVTLPDSQSQLMATLQSIQTNPLFLVSTILGIIFTLWSAFLWTFAVKHARNIDLQQAALTVAGPTVISIGLSASNLLKFL